jgi:hypothetical protein
MIAVILKLSEFLFYTMQKLQHFSNEISVPAFLLDVNIDGSIETGTEIVHPRKKMQKIFSKNRV